MNERFKLSFVASGDSFSAFLYDLSSKKVVWDVTDYSEKLIQSLHFKQASIRQEIGHLRVFWAFLMSQPRAVGLRSIDDKLLEMFRKHALKAAKKSPSSRGGASDVVHATINAKLVRVYDWLFWLQEEGRVPPDTIGYRNAKVQSALQGSSLSRESKKNRDVLAVHKYPLLLAVHTSKSKHRISKYVPTEETVTNLHEHFFAGGGSPYTKNRNVQIIDLASETGFRRNSIQSLHVDQFIGSEFTATDHDTVIIRPARQKFDYGDTFEIPSILHGEIQRFVMTHRKELLSRKRVPDKITQGAVFISEKTCKPMSDQAITAIVSKALRALGAPKGAAIHSFRAKFIVEAIEDEYEDRRDLDLDTSEDTIAEAVAQKVGHRNVRSARAYTSSHAARELSRKKAEKSRLLSELKTENARLSEENKRLAARLNDWG